MKYSLLPALLSFGLALADSPPYQLYSVELPIPPIAQPYATYDINGTSIDFYHLIVEDFDHQVYPGLGPAHLVGYNASSPGPTFVVNRGCEAVVRVTNHASELSSMHLHGADSHSPWDGWAQDVIPTDNFKDYYYGNDQTARSLWYHDHVENITADNAYYGQTGIYIIQDDDEQSIQLPSGDYDIPLAVTDKTYQADGSLASPDGSLINFIGDTIQVNEIPWPYLNVEPRKYRLRLFDMSLSRPYDFWFSTSDAYSGINMSTAIPFQVIGSDGGLFQAPVNATDLQVSMGERYEVLIDFAPYSGVNITLMNALKVPNNTVNSNNTDKVMRFVVGDHVSDSSNNGNFTTLSSELMLPPDRDTIDHTFNFQMGGEDTWTINGVDFDDVENRILARPPQGTVETWQMTHTGGLAVHPIHIHLVDFHVINRTGSRGVPPYESAGLKDVVLIEPGETVTVNAIYGPWNGMYMFHCHNLIHEDNKMLDAFNVTRLLSLGYNSTADLADPADPRFTARASSTAAYDATAIASTVTALANLNAYAPVSALASAESSFYATHGYHGDELSESYTTTTAPISNSGLGFPSTSTSQSTLTTTDASSSSSTLMVVQAWQSASTSAQ